MNEDTLWLQVPAAKTIKKINSTRRSNIEQLGFYSLSQRNSIHVDYNESYCILFIADHGVEIESSLEFSSSITKKILLNFVNKNFHSNIHKPHFDIINLGTKNSELLEGIIYSKIERHTGNISYEEAMTQDQLNKAINIGRQSAQKTKLKNTEIFIAAVINKENTISATSIICTLLNISPEKLLPLITNKNEGGLFVKEESTLIQQALTLHKLHLKSALEILRCLGGFETTALTGSYLCCAHMGLPVLINDFTGITAALITTKLCPNAEQWFLFSHRADKEIFEQFFLILKSQDTINSKKHYYS